MLRFSIRLVPAALAISLLAATAGADTITVVGSDGADGAAGSAGQLGGDGGAGEDADAAAQGPTATNIATATGGSGGGGGSGGDGVVGGNGGDGGAGGDGGGATASAVNEEGTTTNATATGGAGGSGGDGGAAGSGGEDGQPGLGGNGGDARATSCAVPSSGTALALARAAAGWGGDGSLGGTGGAASVLACAESGTHANAGDSFGAVALGGFGGNSFEGAAGGGGSASATSTALGTGTEAIARAEARSVGGAGGSALLEGDGGAGGEASSSASAVAPRPTQATATSQGGGGGLARGVGAVGGAGGAAIATARAESSSLFGANATATALGGNGGPGNEGADGGDGGDVSLAAAASGSSPGFLVLQQLARGGQGGGGSLGGAGGHAASSGDFSNPGGGAIQVDLTAIGGDGGGSFSDSAMGGAAGSALVGGSVRADTDWNATLVASARGGDAGSAGIAGEPGGAVLVGPLTAATSGAGIATVELTAIAGRSGFGGIGADGVDLVLSNAVDGSTGVMGEILLFQQAFGGDGGSGRTTGASGGDAMCLLDAEKSVRHLTLGAIAQAGQGGFSSGPVAAGGDGEVVVRGRNDAGAVVLFGSAIGGSGGGQGGSATATFEATTEGDGNSISIGDTAPVAALGSEAGTASVVAHGTATGDSPVFVRVRARAGSGSGVVGTGPVDGVTGAVAEAEALGRNAGVSSVEVSVEAVGGAGSNAAGAGRIAGAGGLAEARAHGASEAGLVQVSVTQIGGFGGVGFSGAADGAGADSVLDDAATGVTDGALELRQFANGGAGNAIAGDALSRFDVSHLGDGALTLEAEARGGEAFDTAGDASVDVLGEGRLDVTILGRAFGGVAENADGSGGSAELTRLFGRSLEGGMVTVRGLAAGGGGVLGSIGAPGVSIVLENAVDGATSGALVLDQIAVGGSAHAGAGDAISRLAKRTSADSLECRVEADGGDGQNGGGEALAEVDAVNETGAASALALAVAGSRSNSFPSEASDGAAAHVVATATSLGDGHAVRVGSDASSATGAFGGQATLEGAGGSAISHSQAIALGDSEVSVWDFARGGLAGVGAFSGGPGGAAVSRAEGSNQGGASVFVSADAEGGAGIIPSLGGTASASAHGSSLSGDVTVRARQAMGRSGSATAGMDNEMVDAVTGSTAGRLDLLQTAIAGGAGFGAAAVGGDARSVLDAINPGGGDLAATVEAIGGIGGSGERGGMASVAATAVGAADVSLTGRAEGGGGDVGGDAVIERLFATSTTGGDVSVLAVATGAEAFGFGVAADAVLDNVVDGETSGRLALEQRAEGGPGASFESDRRIAGSATSFLERSGSLLELSLRSLATAGRSSFGDGATAEASASGENQTGSSLVEADATAGSSSSAVGAGASARGGDASSSARSVTRADALASSTAVATAGRGGRWTSGGSADLLESARGGRAESGAEAHAEGSEAAVASAFSSAGTGGSVVLASGQEVGSEGGLAFSLARSTGAGTAAVSASAEAIGGEGGSGRGTGASAAGGSAQAQAHASSSGGGEVTVRTSQVGGRGGSSGGGAAAGAGADSIVTDAVTGETSGRLVLDQSATAGGGGQGFGQAGGSAGRAESFLAATNPGGGAIEAISRAIGAGGGGGAIGSRGGDAVAGLVVVGNGSEGVTARAFASGGAGGAGSLSGDSSADGGEARLGRVFASSPNGGDVVVIGSITGGSGGGASGSGADARLIDAVDGETTGSLRLEQEVRGGGSADPSRAGRASSELHKTASAEALECVARAEGSDARVVVSAQNDGGDTRASGLARGIAGSFAQLEVLASSSREGASVVVGAAAVPPPGFGATFGAVGGQARQTLAAGSATSRSEGRHEADGAVTVHDVAIGGSGVFFGNGMRDGADASSTAIASNRGASGVAAHAAASGGDATSSFRDPMASGGSAEALALANGLGSVLSDAVARGGAASSGLGGRSAAWARAEGSTGQATATAIAAFSNPSFFFPEPAFTARVGAQLAAGTALAEATQSAGTFHPGSRSAPAASPDAFIHAAHALSSDALGSALAGNADAGAAFGRDAAEILALVETGGGGDMDRDIVLGSEVEFTASALDVALGDELLIGFLDPMLSGLKSLRIEIALGEQVTIELTFTDGAAAEDFLDDRVFAFHVEPGQALSIEFEMETLAGAPRASLDFLVATVPEPRALALLALVGFALRLARARPLRRAAASPRG